MWRKTILYVVLALTICACTAYTIWTFLPKKEQSRLNILIVGLCSLRYDMLSEYNGGKTSFMPETDDFLSRSSFIFSNMFNGMPWTAFFFTTQSILPGWEIERHLYTRYVNSGRDYIVRVPGRESWHYANKRIDDNDYEKNISREMNYVKHVIQNGKTKPFFLIAHIKYMHYPLIDRFNKDAEWDYFLSAEEKAKVKEYVENPGKYPDKLPFLLLLTNSDEVALKNPGIQAEMNKRNMPKAVRSQKAYKFKGLLSDPAFLQKWKGTPGYEGDLAILKKIYQANARYLDKQIGPMLNLWGDKKLQDTTIVMFTGDHGEMHMEHDMLTHAHSLYEDALRIPTAVRFPGATKPVRLTEQMNFKPFASLIRGVVTGAVDEDNFEKSFHKVQDDAVLLRNCLNTKRGIRFNNQYKYIFDIAEDRPYLYDLKKDPGETENIADANPELVDKFEVMYWRMYPDYKMVDLGDCQGAGESGEAGEG